VQVKFGDEAGVQITKDNIIRWINDAQRALAVNNDLLQRKATSATVVDQTAYALPSDILQARSVKWQGHTLHALSQAEADHYVRDNETDVPTGTPTHYWIWANSIYLYPAPSSAGSADLELYYIRQPVSITEDIATLDSTALDLPLTYHNAIVDYVLVQAYELDDNWNAADRKAAHFAQASTDLKNPADTNEFYPFINSAWEDYA